MKHLVCLLSVAGALVCPAVFERATPESQGVPSAAIEAFVNACEKELDGIHGFVLLRHGKRVAEGWWHPFDADLTQHVFSHSKVFSSTAVGLLYDEGKIKLDDRLIDIFPDKAPAQPSEEAKLVRVRDLLTMNVGQNTEAIFVEPDGDWVQALLRNKFDRKPGTGFRYDSCASHVLAAIVERKTGRKLMDYLDEKLFRKIGIQGAWTNVGPDGIACGGWGMNFKTLDLARLGQLYLQEGLWEGEQVLSREWVQLATSHQTKTDRTDGGDWAQGYGFQFWRCRNNCYRADGASGQYTIVMPDQDAVLSITAGLSDMAHEQNLVWKHLLPALKEPVLPEDPVAFASLQARCRTLQMKPVSGNAAPAQPVPFGTTFDLTGDAGRFGLKDVALVSRGTGWVLAFTGLCGRQEIPVGQNEWRHGRVRLEREKYEKLGGLIGEQPTAASGAWTHHDTFETRVLLTGTPSWMHFKLTFKADGTLALNYSVWGWGGGSWNLSGTEKK